MNDLISRQEAIAVVEGCGEYILPNGIFRSDVLYALKKLPSAQPERKKGKWVDGGMRGVYYCSECKHEIMTNVYVDQRPLWKYCPNCGSCNGGDNNEVD